MLGVYIFVLTSIIIKADMHEYVGLYICMYVCRLVGGHA